LVSAAGTRSEQFCYYFGERIISKLDYLIDLHTASFGRVNSFYVRANMLDAAIAKMARLVRPQIIVHNKGQGGDGGSCVVFYCRVNGWRIHVDMAAWRRAAGGEAGAGRRGGVVLNNIDVYLMQYSSFYGFFEMRPFCLGNKVKQSNIPDSSIIKPSRQCKRGCRGTLRGHAMKLGVKAICIEIGNPNAFMEDLIRMCYLGIARFA
jgi:hypothetical protein